MLNAAVVGLGWWGKQIVTCLDDSEKITVTRGVDVSLDGLAAYANHRGAFFAHAWRATVPASELRGDVAGRRGLQPLHDSAAHRPHAPFPDDRGDLGAGDGQPWLRSGDEGGLRSWRMCARWCARREPTRCRSRAAADPEPFREGPRVTSDQRPHPVDGWGRSVFGTFTNPQT